MPGGRRLSRGELIRQREQAQFVVRRAQLSLFAENLDKDPQSYEDPAEFLFHVRGVGGVGKSTLLRQWQEAARDAGAVTAVVDESDVHGVRQALAGLARQLGEQTGPLKEFDKALEQLLREQSVPAQPAPVDGEASVSSRIVTQAALGAASLLPGAGVVTAMTNPDAAAQGLDRLRSGARARAQRRARGSDDASLSRAFVAELERLSQRHLWVVLFFDTWEHTGPYLDEWLLSLLEEKFGPVPANVMVVLAGRDQLAERQWAPLRAQVADVPLEVFTEAETRSLLASRGVSEPGVVEAVLRLSMGLPLLVALLALARPTTAEEVDAGGDVTDAAVERFVQWITDHHQREAVRACALPLQLNEDVFAAAVSPEAEGLWEWLCGQPFVGGRGDFKNYHAVVRASLVRQQRAHSPQRWTAAHVRLADTHAAWRTSVEEDLAEWERWGSARWRRHRLDESYHRLCAHPAGYATSALEQLVQAAGQDTAVLRQWLETFEQAAHDTADAALLDWSGRLRETLADDEPALACLSILLTHPDLSTEARGWAHAHRGRRLYLADRDEEAITELDRAVTLDARNALALIYRAEARNWLNRTDGAVADFTAALELDHTRTRALTGRGEAHRRAGRYEEAIADLTAALELDPSQPQFLGDRGQSHRLAGHDEEAVADLTAALELDPTFAWAFADRGETHRLAGRYEEALADFTAALELDPAYAWAFARRGETHRLAGRYEQAVADLTAALELDPAQSWILGDRGQTHQQAGRYEEALADFTAAVELDPAYAWAFGRRGETHRLAGRYEEAVADLTAALELDPTYAWALAERGETHRLAGRYELAVADFTAAVGLEPTYAWALAERGETHRLAGRYELAVADFTAAVGLEPTYAWALAQRGETRRRASEYEEAVADFTAALELEPTYESAFARRGATHRQTGRYEQAVADLTAALELDPTFAWAFAHRGETHRQAGRLEEAIADFTAAVELNPAFDWALATRGQTHRQAGHYDQAREDLDRAVEADPEEVGYVFERLMLDTVESGFGTCAEQWRQLFATPTATLDEDSLAVITLFQAVILGPDQGVRAAAESFLSGGPDLDLTTDVLGYLSELAALTDEPADRARHCRQLVAERAEAVRDDSQGP
ncbi:tetratricopeptide repeat protein [Streptomyces sp. NPDC050433]|uniref:tetratricopeptide repeat protein n=1 Tax=Streptomyces sp. NPDC050433 TaxID=3365615 RepID=UPI00378C1E3A